MCLLDNVKSMFVSEAVSYIKTRFSSFKIDDELVASKNGKIGIKLTNNSERNIKLIVKTIVPKNSRNDFELVKAKVDSLRTFSEICDFSRNRLSNPIVLEKGHQITISLLRKGEITHTKDPFAGINMTGNEFNKIYASFVRYLVLKDVMTGKTIYFKVIKVSDKVFYFGNRILLNLSRRFETIIYNLKSLEQSEDLSELKYYF